jgi:large subunit ribosomal protein L10
MPSQLVMEEKQTEIEAIKELLVEYKSIGIANLQKVRATQLQELKKHLAGQVFMKVMKNTLIKLAIDNMDNANMKQLDQYLDGSNVYLFTNINPFKLSLLLEKGRVKTTAKAGDISAMDIVIPTGNTGQPPGPIISQLNSVGLPTRIESGSVWISKDTLVVRKGEEINERLASVLSKLGIKAVEAGLSMRVAFDEGLIITQEQLKLDVAGTKKSVEASFGEAFALSMSIAYPTAENINTLLQTVHQQAFALSLSAAIPNKETMPELIRKANAQMTSLNSAVEKVKPK